MFYNTLNKIKFFIFIIFTFILNSAFTINQYKLNDPVYEQIIINKNFKIDISGDGWFMARKESHFWKSIDQRIYGFIKIKNGELMEAIEIYQGNVQNIYIGHIDLAILKIVFKNKYDGCYERPEYYLLEVYKKGRTHNCMIVRHWDVNKEIYNPDDPELNAVAMGYRRFIKANSIKLPKIALASEHSYFSRHNAANWYRILYVVNPKVLNSPKSKLLTEDSSEYHKYNIKNFPEHKKVMDNWISISSKRHRNFENQFKAKKNHLLDLDKYIIADGKKKYSKEMLDQLKQIDELYKSGVLSKDEFEKAKKRILN